MKSMLSLVLLLSFLVNNLHAQTSLTPNDSVKVVVKNLFAAMKTGDTVLLKSCFAQDAIMQTISKNKDGKINVRTESVAEFITFIGKEKSGDADERLTASTILIDGDLASFWAPYKFYYKGSFSHCGANSFQLVKINGEWKIQYLIDTRRKTGCDN